MGKPTGFLEQDRELPKKRDPKKTHQRLHEVDAVIDESITLKQASRCMDCVFRFAITVARWAI